MIANTKLASQFLRKVIVKTIKPSLATIESRHGYQAFYQNTSKIMNTQKFMFSDQKNKGNVSDQFKQESKQFYETQVETII